MTLKIIASFPEGEIYSSGTIIFRDLDKPLDISITPEIGSQSPYHVRVKLLHIEGEVTSVRWTSSDDRVFNLDIINFDNPYGLTLHHPVVIGSYEQRQVLLDFAVYTLGNYPRSSPRMFCYTIRQGETINV
jgi:hypothetical protein